MNQFLALSWCAAIGALGILGGCGDRAKPDYERSLPAGAKALVPVPPGEPLPDLSTALADRENLILALDHSLEYLAKPSAARYYPYLDITRDQTIESLKIFRTMLKDATDPSTFDRDVKARFQFYRSVGYDGRGSVLFTGYCEPIYKASVQKNDIFKYPLYRLPPDLVRDDEGRVLGRRLPDGTMTPEYPSRRDIDADGLFSGQNLELVYLADPFEAYIVHVQGSARLQLTDGREMRVGYAGTNGREYVAIGPLLKGDGKVQAQNLSLTILKDYFRQYPEDVDPYIQKNPRYTFFTETQGGPFGSLGVPVTPRRSIATDKDIFPRGALAFVTTRLKARPDSPATPPDQQSLHAFVLDQDTGGAIRAAGRTDVFVGTGPAAELEAGKTLQEGLLFYLFLDKDPPSPVPATPDASGPSTSIADGSFH